MTHTTLPAGAQPSTLSDAALPDGRRVDVTLRDGRIHSISDVSAHRPDDDVVDCGGALLMPAFVDGHCHLDKTFWGSAWRPHRSADSLRQRIIQEKELRTTIEVPMAERATTLARHMAALGTGHLRCHVDIDPEAKLSGLHTLLEVRDQLRDILTIQLVAFPQSGVVSAPGVADLLDAALAEGADLIGGLDPGGFDNDVDGQLDVVFRLAERHGAGIDIHLHDGGEFGTGQLRDIAGRTAALGMGGRVTVSHAYALGQVDGAEVDRTAAALSDAQVAIMTNGPANTMPPVLRLRDNGVLVFAGSDNIRDAWWPYGTGDMLERATIIGLQGDLMRDDELAYAASLITDGAATALGLTDYGLRPGGRADLVLVAAGGVGEAVAAHPDRLLVLHGGRAVASSR